MIFFWGGGGEWQYRVGNLIFTKDPNQKEFFFFFFFIRWGGGGGGRGWGRYSK